ncbi:hypothetical protein CW367_02100 [Bacillus subtilis]|nr:hypothetical protein [Bacillus subtilis]
MIGEFANIIGDQMGKSGLSPKKTVLMAIQLEAEEQLWPINTVPQQISHCMLKGWQLNGCINIF